LRFGGFYEREANPFQRSDARIWSFGNPSTEKVLGQKILGIGFWNLSAYEHSIFILANSIPPDPRQVDLRRVLQ
jgi:hypothetical protein